MTPCMSPLPHDSPLIEKPGLGQIQEESEGAGFKTLPGKGLNIYKSICILTFHTTPRFYTYRPANLTLSCEMGFL